MDNGGVLDSWEQRIIPRYGYAVPAGPNASAKRAADWSYMELEAGLADHFLHPLFRDRHDLFVWRQSPQGTLIGFCPRTKSVPEIQGVLVLDHDGRLMSAEWAFVLSSDRVRAGGETQFLPSDTFLLPTIGIAWQEVRRGTHRQNVWVYNKWVPVEAN